jgi:hypothetical protein
MLGCSTGGGDDNGNNDDDSDDIGCDGDDNDYVNCDIDGDNNDYDNCDNDYVNGDDLLGYSTVGGDDNGDDNAVWTQRIILMCCDNATLL